MPVTIQDFLDRGYIEPDSRDTWPIRSAYRWTGLGQVNCHLWVTPEKHVDQINAGLIRYCVSCLRSMIYKKSGQVDPAHSNRVVCRPCFAQGKRLGDHT